MLAEPRRERENVEGGMMRVCDVEGCGSKHYCRGYCIRHYRRFKFHGDPLAGRIDDGLQLKFLSDALNTESDACIEWPFQFTSRGYGRIKDGYVSRGAHRVMCRMAHGEPPSDTHHAAHSCHNRACVNPRHIRWATAYENVQDREEAGRTACGEAMGSSKLTKTDVLVIRSSGQGASELAEKYGVGR